MILLPVASLRFACGHLRRQIDPMCNSYRINPKREARGKSQRVSEAAEKLSSGLVRKSDPGVVVRADGKVDVMRWGFHRKFNPTINNARSDKLEVGMWADAFRERRCVIPMSLFYEWGAGSAGRKQAYEIHAPDDDYLWVAGIWEEHAELGPCYSLITTAASPLMATVHDRMPAVLRPEQMEAFMAGDSQWDFQPFDSPLVIRPCDSPLAKRKPSSDSQPELF